MANTIIQLKKSGLVGNTPSSLNYGELALNYADGKLFYKNSLGSIVSLTAGLATYSFSTINASSTLILAGSSSDTLSFAGANGVTITGNTSSKTVTVGLNTSLVTSNLSNYQSVTNATTGTWYPALYNATSGNLAVNANNALSFNSATGGLTSTSFSGAGTGLTGTASSLSIGGTSLNITQYTINQNLGVSNWPTFAGLTSNTATGRVGLGTDSGGSISLGIQGNNPTPTSPYIDFNTSANVIDYDVRIIASGNNSINGGGDLNIYAANTILSGTLSATSFSGAGTGLTGTASSLTTGLATNIVGGSTNRIPYQTGTNTTGFIAAPTQNNTFLNYTTSGGLSWQPANTTSVGTSNVSTYQTVTNATTGTWYPALYNGTSGDRQVNANNALSFNSATGALSATSFNASGITQSTFTDSSGVSTYNQTLKIGNGTNWLAFQANASGGSYNGITTTGDVALWFSNGSGTSSSTPGNLIIAPWAGFNFGLRLNSAANTVAITGSITSTANITASSGTVSASRLTSTVATGTAPLTVTSTTLVTNLNTDYLDGQHGSYYAPLTLAQAAYDTANSKTYTFEQNTAPTTSNTSDLWVNTDTGYVYQNFGNTSSPIWAEFGPTGIGNEPGAIIGTSGTFSSNVTVSYLPATTSATALQITAANTQGGTGYADVLKFTNSSGGATNPNKFIRVNITGGLEIIDSTYLNNIFTITNGGNISSKGTITPGAYSPGEVIKDTMLSNSEVTVVTTTIAATGSNVNFITYNYTPVSSSSYLVVHIHISRYEPQGTTDDSWFSVLSVDGTEISYGWQMVNDNGLGTSGRSGVLFPLTGRYTNSSTSSKQIQVAARRDVADDSIIITNSATGIWLRITEIAR